MHTVTERTNSCWSVLSSKDCFKDCSTSGGADFDSSCRPWTEVALWTVNGSSLACYPFPLSESQN